MGKVSVCVLIAIVAVVAVVASESEVEVDGPFTYNKQQELKKKFDKIRAKSNKKPAKTFKPKEFMHRRHIKIVPKGDPRARDPATLAPAPVADIFQNQLQSDSSPLAGAAADIASAFGAARFSEQTNPSQCEVLHGTCGTAAECAAKDGRTEPKLCPGDKTIICCFPKPSTTVQPVTPVVSDLPKCSNNGARSGSYKGDSPLLNVKNKATTWELWPSLKSYGEESGNPYRVVRDAYGDLPSSDSRLVNVPSSGGQQKLHKVCAARFNAMAAKALADGAGVFKVASGWRAHPYNNNYQTYCAAMKRYYPNLSCADAGKLRAFKSPHETGLAFDLGSPPPFEPTKAKDNLMRASKGFKWMVDNAHKFGITPYKYEAWHWECVIPREAWVTACEFTDNYNTRLQEKTSSGGLTTNAGAWN